MSPPLPTPDRRVHPLRRALPLLGWLSAGTLVAVGPLAPPRRAAPLGPRARRLAEGLPPLAPAPAGAPAPAAAPDAASPAATPASAVGSGPLRALVEFEAALTGRESVARIQAPAGPPADTPSRTTPDRRLPRPFAELRTLASPLIMPRLRLPRVLEPGFPALRQLAARARPDEPVHVKLTAYCLDGTTRRGTPTRPGIVAADPRVFPMARHVELYAAGRFLGRFRVEDTGGAVRGPHIDIWTPDCADARRFGTRPGIASLVRLGRD